ncbi:MAG TPA: tetratricopeptide repeat protein [Polyangiales bacterium]|nr:tetratricopeptide repeat protein [Polyangiales bacterium]
MSTALLLASAGARSHAQDVQAAGSELTNVEAEAASLRNAPLRGSELRSPTYVEERLTDGELFYRLQDYVRASIIFTDIVEHYPQHAAYPDAVFLLAESLFQAKDYLGARAKYRVILDHADDKGFRPHLQRSLGRLIEIAIHIQNFDGIEVYFERLARLPPSEVEAATAYFRAKYLYSVAVPGDVMSTEESKLPELDANKLDQARAAFEAVQQNSPYFAQARYFIGVIYTLRGQYNQAIESFNKVAAIKPTSDQQRDVIELAMLAAGRLYYETNQLDRAIGSYQALPRTSRRFDTALYETAWTYIRMGDSTQAERSLEVLSVAAPESKYIPDAKLLRGNLLLRDGQYEQATTVFNEVTREFQPVREDLDRMVAQHEDPHAYFKGLVTQNLENFDAQAFLPPLALRWATVDGDMQRALDAVADLSQARRMTRETSSVVERLQNALHSPNPVNIFPDLRHQRERTIALRNRLSRVRTQLIAADEASGRGGAELQAVRTRRLEVERALAGLPLKDTDFEKRNANVDTGFVALNKQLSSLEVQLLGMDAQIVATERFIGDTMHDPAQQAGVQAYRAELSTQQKAIADYREQLERLGLEIESGRIQVGVGDSTYVRDDQLRAEHAQLVEQERNLIGSTGKTDILFRRVEAAEATIAQHDAAIDKVVAERSADMQKVLDDEGGKLTGYRERLAQLDGETVDVVGGITYANFRKVQERFYDLVLKADVGIVDVGWAEREEHRTRIDMLTRERNRALQALDDEFNEITDERGKQ